MKKLPTWQLQDAKNRFSELVDAAMEEGPQVVTRHGDEAAVVMGYEQYLVLTGRRRPSKTFTEYLLAAPRLSGGLRAPSRRDLPRKVELE